MKDINLWTKDELIIALNLYWKIPYNKISGSANPKIKELAAILHRTPAAIAYKLMNFTSLDPERQRQGNKGKARAGKLDEIIWTEYHNRWEELAYDSTILLSKLQNKNIDEFQNDEEYNNYKGKEKERIVKTRINQNYFRERILASYNERCCITNVDIPTLLVASHIIPWAKNENERLNPQNGICLNSFHDKAFDKGLITISTDYRIKISSNLLKRKNDSSIQNFFLQYENQQIILPDRYLPDKKFLNWHNDNIFIH